jgi:MuDR family transposase
MVPPPPVLEVGGDFDASTLLKEACRNFAITNGFEFNTERSNKSLYTITCKVDDCSWRLYASVVKGTTLFRVKTFTSNHTYFGLNHGGNSVATAKNIASKIVKKVKDQLEYRPATLLLTSNAISVLKSHTHLRFEQRILQSRQSMAHTRTPTTLCLSIAASSKLLIQTPMLRWNILLKTSYSGCLFAMEHVQLGLLRVVLFSALMVPISNTNTKESSLPLLVSTPPGRYFLSCTVSSALKTTIIRCGFSDFSRYCRSKCT